MPLFENLGIAGMVSMIYEVVNRLPAAVSQARLSWEDRLGDIVAGGLGLGCAEAAVVIGVGEDDVQDFGDGVNGVGAFDTG